MAASLLCQRGQASCGACCGLYNRRDLRRAALHALLARRTRMLSALPLSALAFRQAAERLRALEGEPVFPSVRTCPLLGFLDAAETRVGCLAHPSVTGGPDLRDCGAYDRETCDGFYCAAHGALTEEEAQLLAEALPGEPWLYGLVVTDPPFLRSALRALGRLKGRPVERADLAVPRLRRALVQLLALKEELAPGSDGLFRAFDPHEEREAFPGASSPAEELLERVGADARSGNDLEALEGEVRRRLSRCRAAFGTARPGALPREAGSCFDGR